MQQTAYACHKPRQVNWHRHELANAFSMLREFWPRREQNLDAGTLMPSHQSQGDAVRLSWRKAYASDQHLHALSILQRIQSGHRIGKRGHFIANEPKSIDSL